MSLSHTLKVQVLLLFMLLFSTLLLLISNSVTFRRDLAILFNRIAIIILMYCVLLSFFTLSLDNKGIGIHGGLLFVNNFSKFLIL